MKDVSHGRLASVGVMAAIVARRWFSGAPQRLARLGLLAGLAAALAPGSAAAAPAASNPGTPGAVAPAQEATVASGSLRIPDVALVDQDGRTVRFWSGLVQGKVVAVSFVFTTCTTICPPLGANFARLRQLLGNRAGSSVELISLSVDPATDTPQRLKAWAAKFGGGPGWTLLTGPKVEVDRLLRALQAFTPNFADHSPLLLIGNAATGTWERTSGLAPAATIAAQLERLGAPPAARRTTAPAGMALHVVPALNTAADASAGPVAAAAWTEHAPVAPPSQPALPPPSGPLSPARKYFSDVELVDQDGRTHRFYSDLLQGKTVVIEAFFTSCAGSCPVLGQKLAALQEWLGDRLGKDVYLLSFTVDPQHDTPARLKQYAGQLGARSGWYFLTGRKENVDWALYKVGHYVEQKEDHSNLLIMGNEATGLWKKVFGLAPSADLIHSLDGVLHDHG